MASVEDHKNEIPRIVDEMKELDGTEMTAGIHGSDDSFMSMLAQVHEFGVDIQVTEDMRNWFLAQGFPLSEDTTVITIPARPFLRTAWDLVKRSLGKVKDVELQKIVDGNQDAFGAASKTALHMQNSIRQQFGKHGPELSGMTVEMKGSASKLEDTGRMRQAIAAKVDQAEVSSG